MQEVRQEHEDKDENLEMQKPTLPTRPEVPSLTEREEHEASGHAVYRSWCEHCIAAKGQANPHKADGEACEIPEIGFDYGYMSRKEAKCQEKKISCQIEIF